VLLDTPANNGVESHENTMNHSHPETIAAVEGICIKTEGVALARQGVGPGSQMALLALLSAYRMHRRLTAPNAAAAR
jgi:hypothetical protein